MPRVLNCGWTAEYFRFANADALQEMGFLVEEATHFYPDPDSDFPVSRRPAEDRKEMARVEAPKPVRTAGKG